MTYTEIIENLLSKGIAVSPKLKKRIGDEPALLHAILLHELENSEDVMGGWFNFDAEKAAEISGFNVENVMQIIEYLISSSIVAVHPSMFDQKLFKIKILEVK